MWWSTSLLCFGCRFHRCAWSRLCSTVEASQWHLVWLFLGRVHRYTARVPPPSGRGRGGGDAGSLLPGVLPPELVASYARAWSDTPCRQLFVPQTPHALPNNTTHNITRRQRQRERKTERQRERQRKKTRQEKTREDDTRQEGKKTRRKEKKRKERREKREERRD